MSQAMLRENVVEFTNAGHYAKAPKAAVIFEHDMSLRDIEKSVILETLRRQSYNRTHTAKVLGIGIRTLQRKLKLYRDIDHEKVLEFMRF